MFHSYSVTSTVLSLRNNGSLSFSFNDCSSNLLNSPIEKTPLSASPCCSSCCSSAASSCACCCFARPTFVNVTHSVPITPCFLYGLRQSALVHCSPSRRRFLPTTPRCFLRFPSCDLDRDAFEVSTARIFRTKTKRKVRCMASEENSSRDRLGGVDAAEAMISLLAEEIGGECLGDGGRNRSLYKIVEVEKRKNYDSNNYSENKNKEHVEKTRSHSNECRKGRKKITQVEHRGSHVNEQYREKNKNVDLGLLESDSKDENEFVSVGSREDNRRAEGESYLRAENRRGRTKSSSCSSYYSVSSSGDLDSDTELPEPEEQIVEESLSGHMMESIRNEKSKSEGHAAEGFKRDNAGGNIVDWDLRKKSEKKLVEVYGEDIQSIEKSSQEYARRVKMDDIGYVKLPSSHEQLDDKDWETRKRHTQTDNQFIRQAESRKKSPEVRDISKIHVSDTGATSQKKQFTGEKANLKVSEVQDRAERISTSQRQSESRMKIEEEDTTLVHGQSESRMKIWEEDTTKCQSSFQQTRKQRGERITGQLELRGKSECLSEIGEDKTNKTSVLLSETQRKKQDDTSSLILNPETKKQHLSKDQIPPQGIEGIELLRGLQTVTNISVVQTDNIETVTNSQTIAEKHENNFISVSGPISERSDRYNETNASCQQMKPRRENLIPSIVSSSWGKAEEGSSSHASLSLVSEAQEQQFQVKSEKRSTEQVLMPPQSQLTAGGLIQDDSMTRISTQEASVETLGSGFSTSYMHSKGRTTLAHHEPYSRERSEIHEEPLSLTMHKDSLGSAQRLEESSSQFVGEFIENARYEVSTSEVQHGKRSSDLNLVYDADKHGPNVSGRHSKEEFKLKKHDSRQSSKGSGAKGPTDEMWDVRDPSVQESPGVEIPQETATSEHAVVKRSGRSLWSLMGDIIRLRWGARAQTPSSAARSGERTSPNESGGSETWFSGREQDENSEDNLRRERGNMSSEVITYQLGQETQGETDVPYPLRSNDKIRHFERNMSPSSNISQTATASEGISSTLQKERHDKSSFKVASTGKEVATSSLPVPASSIRTSPDVEEISQTDKVDIHGSGSIRVMEQPFDARLTEASGSHGKGGELKQRKLQRTKQVPRDRFDEWEELYTLEREQRKIDEMFMREALLEAKNAADSWEVPVGAVLVQNGKIIARGRNLVEELRDSTAHAEMICIREASSILRSWRLADATLYVTLEPCPMCAGAILQARINTLVWGAPNKLLGADGSWIRLFPDERGDAAELSEKPAAPVHPFHPKMTIRRGILESECADAMQQFFHLRRKKKEKNVQQPPPPSCLPTTNHPSKFFTKMHDILHLMFCL